MSINKNLEKISGTEMDYFINSLVPRTQAKISAGCTNASFLGTIKVHLVSYPSRCQYAETLLHLLLLNLPKYEAFSFKTYDLCWQNYTEFFPKSYGSRLLKAYIFENKRYRI